MKLSNIGHVQELAAQRAKLWDIIHRSVEANELSIEGAVYKHVIVPDTGLSAERGRTMLPNLSFHRAKDALVQAIRQEVLQVEERLRELGVEVDE